MLRTIIFLISLTVLTHVSAQEFQASIILKTSDIYRVSPTTHINSDTATLWVSGVKNVVINEENQTQQFQKKLTLLTPSCYTNIKKIVECDYLPLEDDKKPELHLTGDNVQINAKNIIFSEKNFTCEIKKAPRECL